MFRTDGVGVHGMAGSLSTLILVVLLVFTSQALAEVYKWVDERGRVHYGDKPTSDNAEKVTIQKGSANDPLASEREEKRRKLLDIYQEDRSRKKSDRAARIEEKKQRQANCAQAREKLEEIRRASYLYKDGNDAENREILSDSERGRAERESQQAVNKWCD